ncbi:GNAT family N-acetyltransferase [Vogesella mureinivorans]|uniref:GNAT family N-acetyltransferase n=1 Tax=Vogesella mureinivorans TaxID=657276 RepID=UPI0011CA56D0|nr:GNAT family N-acetyltransferase [Vogesella mureinivorans]
MTPHTPQLTLRQAEPRDAARCYAIESSAYEGDEAATAEKIALRIAQYPAGFLVLECDGELVGFINSGCAHQVEMADEAFKELIGHDPAAANVVIMSVVVDPAWQGHGYAGLLMRAFIQRMQAAGKQAIHLMCKPQHVALYTHMGYQYVQPSASLHGGMQWHEMVLPLGAAGQPRNSTTQ